MASHTLNPQIFLPEASRVTVRISTLSCVELTTAPVQTRWYVWTPARTSFVHWLYRFHDLQP